MERYYTINAGGLTANADYYVVIGWEYQEIYCMYWLQPSEIQKMLSICLLKKYLFNYNFKILKEWTI